MLTTKWYHAIRYGELYIFQIEVKETAKQYRYDNKDQEVTSFNGKKERTFWVVNGSRFDKMDHCISDTYEEARSKLKAELYARLQTAEKKLAEERAMLDTFNSVEYIKQ